VARSGKKLRWARKKVKVGGKKRGETREKVEGGELGRIKGGQGRSGKAGKR
jgi:hypothetical protein